MGVGAGLHGVSHKLREGVSHKSRESRHTSGEGVTSEEKGEQGPGAFQ